MVRARAGVIALVVAACGGGGGGGVDAPAAPDAAGGAAATADELVDACVKYLGCLDLGGSISSCVENAAEQDPVEVRCLAAATTCDAALGCLSITRFADPACTVEDCSATGSAVSCYPGVRLEQDCAARGQSCTMGVDGSYCQDECELESCAADVLDRCDDNPDL